MVENIKLPDLNSSEKFREFNFGNWMEICLNPIEIQDKINSFENLNYT